jgi:hypothetical protein
MMSKVSSLETGHDGQLGSTQESTNNLTGAL